MKVNEKLLKALTGKCKDMGLSPESIQKIAAVASNGLEDAATDEAIEQRANEYLPVLQAMQSEATRWAQGKQKPQQQPQPQPNPTPTNPQPSSVEEIVAAVTERLKGTIEQQTATINELQAKLTKGERNTAIANECKRLGLSEADMAFVTVPDDVEVADYLGRYKQSLIDRGLKPQAKEVTAAAQEKAEQELATAMLSEFEVKPD